ncbi:MAG TPA: hypothetical protein VIM02_07695 [Rhizomicrobium sp.]|jgi:hypothetical protein
MSDGVVRHFWKQNKAAIQITIFLGAVALAVVIPFIQAPLCSVTEQDSATSAYQVTEDRKSSKESDANSIYPTITKFTFGPSLESRIGEIERSQTTYYAPKQKVDWGRKFWCDINAGDYFLVLFTLALAVSTFYLWRETERLAKGADEQTKRMIEQIEFGRAASYAATKSAEVADTSMKNAQRAFFIIKELTFGSAVNSRSDTESGDFLLIVTTMENVGITPARDTMALADKIETLPGVAPEFDPSALSATPGTTVGPRGVIKPNWVMIHKDAVWRSHRGQSDLYGIIRVEYRDVFVDTRRVFQHCFKIQFRVDPDRFFSDATARDGMVFVPTYVPLSVSN